MKFESIFNKILSILLFCCVIYLFYVGSYVKEYGEFPSETRERIKEAELRIFGVDENGTSLAPKSSIISKMLYLLP